ncbi:MAG TPA: sulfite exporter TauE/SafE family protein [Longimicrobiales bacterium]
MSALVLLALLAVGLLVGFTAGLIGIGGGVLIVPFLYFFYAHPEWAGFALPVSLQVAVAHATSLFVILPTAIRGSVSYSKAGLVVWQVALPVAAAALIGGVLGARLAIILPAELLKLIFGVFLVASGGQLMLRRGHAEERAVRTNLFATSITGLMVGTLSGMMGVGGGILALPMLMYLLHVDLRRAAATSLAIIGFAACGGLLTYALSGAHVAGRAPLSLGYIHFGAGLPILVGSLISVHWGTVVNQRTKTPVLRYIFATVFIVLGIQFILKNLRAVLF